VLLTLSGDRALNGQLVDPRSGILFGHNPKRRGAAHTTPRHPAATKGSAKPHPAAASEKPAPAAPRITKQDVGALFALVATFGVIYGLTLFTGPDPFGDRTKFMFLGKILGISHPTGFPLYMLLNHLVADLPVGALAVRENAFSAALSIAALCCVYVIARALSVGTPVAFCAAVLLGISPTFWRQAIVAEVYALHALLVAGICLALILWQQRPTRRSPLYAALLLLALSAANHPTSIAMIPPVLYMLVRTDRKVLLDWKVVTAAGVFLALSLSTYGYLLWRTHVGGPHLEFHVGNLRELVDYMTGSRYRSHDFFAYSTGQVLFSQIPLLGKTIWQELGIGLILAGVGGFVLRPRSVRNYLVLVSVSFLVLLANCTFRKSEYLIPVCIPLVVLVAVGAAHLGGTTRRRDVVGAVLILICIAVTASSGLALVRRDRGGAKEFDQELLGVLDRLDDNAFLMLRGYRDEYGEFEGLSYYVWGEGRGGRDVFVSTYQPPATIYRYLVHGVPFVDPVSSRTIPPGIRMFASLPSYCRAIAQSGIACRQDGPGLYELVRSSTTPP
jgi:hypothetical protein